MVDAIFRIPSRTVQYGYIEVSVPFREDGSEVTPEMLAAKYVNFVYAFQKEEEAAIKRLQGKPESATEAAPGDPQAAADRLAQGKKPRTVDEANEMATQAIKQLGATVVDEEMTPTSRDDAPWNKTPAPTAKKPWEAGNEPAKPSVTLDAGW